MCQTCPCSSLRRYVNIFRKDSCLFMFGMELYSRRKKACLSKHLLKHVCCCFPPSSSTGTHVWCIDSPQSGLVHLPIAPGLLQTQHIPLLVGSRFSKYSGGGLIASSMNTIPGSASLEAAHPKLVEVNPGVIGPRIQGGVQEFGPHRVWISSPDSF